MEIEYFIFNYWYQFFMVLLKNLSYIVIDLDLGFLSPDPDRQKNPDPKHALPANSMVIRKVFLYQRFVFF